MNDVRSSQRAKMLRGAFGALVALLVGGLVALGISAPAFATVTFTLRLTTKSGSSLTGYGIYPIAVANGAEAPGDNPVAMSPVDGKAGYYSESLATGTRYTILFVPDGASATSGTIQYLGGAAGIAGAASFDPAANPFLGASIATGATISGKVETPGGSDVKGAEVDAYRFDGSAWTTNNHTTTNSRGDFSFDNAVPGMYRFEYYYPGATYPPVFSGGSPTLAGATTSFAAVGSSVSLPTQKFVAGTGSITGTAVVTFPASGGGSQQFYDDNLYPVALPVTASTGSGSTQVATAVDTDKSVAGGRSNSHGVWTVSHLPAGQYVIQLYPGYLGESIEYVTDADSVPGDAHTLADASVITVNAGQTVTLGQDTFQGSALDGSDPQITIDNSGTTPVPGATIELYPVDNPLDVTTGTAGSNGVVSQLIDGGGDPITLDNAGDGKDNPLEPGEYAVKVVDPTDANDPLQTTEYLDFGTPAITLKLPAFSGMPGLTGTAISGTATAVGTTYSVSPTSARADGVKTYQWLRDGQPIVGATSTTYTSTGADYQHQVAVRETVTSFGFNPFYATVNVGGGAGTPTTIGSAPVDSTVPTITSSSSPVYIGSTLQASTGGWNLNGTQAFGLSYSYTWFSGGVQVGTGSSYVVQASDFPSNTPNAITVTVQATKDGYTPSSVVTSASVTPSLHAAPAVTKAPVVTKKTSSGVTTYSVSTGSWNVSGLTYFYDWRYASTDLSTGSTLTSSAAGFPVLPSEYPITVIVEATKVGYTPGLDQLAAAKGTDSFHQTGGATVRDGRTGSTLSGGSTLYYGDVLTVTHPGTYDNPGGFQPTSYTYQWLNNGSPISGATSATYTVGSSEVSADPGRTISVVETPVSAFFTSGPAPLEVVGQGSLETLPNSRPEVDVTGAVEDGQTVAASVGSWGVTGVTDSYQWYECASPCSGDAYTLSNYSKISGATKSTLSVKLAYYDLAVVVTGTKTGYESGSPYDLALGVQPKTQIINTSPATISGLSSSKAIVGTKLTANRGTWSVSGLTYAYQWIVTTSGGSSTVSTSSSYTPTAADYDSAHGVIRLNVTASLSSTGPSTTSSTPTYTIAPGTLRLTTAPKLTKSGTVFTVSNGTVSPAASSPTFLWHIDAAAGSTSNQQDVAAAVGKAVYVDVTWTVAGYTPLTSRLVAQQGTTTAGVAVITGGTTYGNTLTAGLSTAFTDAQSGTAYTLGYQWYEGSSSKAISGATSSTYKPSSSYIGKTIKVTITGKTSLYATSSASASITLGEGVFTPSSNPLFSSSTSPVEPGSALSVVPGADYVPAGSSFPTFSYKWQLSSDGGVTYATISGATKSTYTVLASQVTERIRAEVTASKTGYTSLTIPTGTFTIQYSPTLSALAPPSLSTPDLVGSAITVNPGVWNTPSLTYGYAWYRNGTLIGGVTGSSWTPTADSAGTEITVTITASRSGWVPVAAATQEVLVQPGVIGAPTSKPTISKSGSGSTAVYSVSAGSWNVNGLTYTYQWNVGGVAASGTGATTSSFTPDGSQSGQLTVDITVSRNGYTTPPVETVAYATNL